MHQEPVLWQRHTHFLATKALKNEQKNPNTGVLLLKDMYS